MTAQNQRGGFRTKQQKERDRSFIATLYVKNFSLQDMADKLAEFVQDEGDDYRLTPQQVWYDCKQILIEWKRTRLSDIDDFINIELKKLDRIENELWIAWDKSKGGKRKTKIDGGTLQGGAVTGGSLKERILEETNGDPRFLDQIMQVMDRRAKLLGYNAPLKVQITTSKEAEEQKKKSFSDIPDDVIMQMSDHIMGIKRINPALN